jgi:hypothetical protein
MRILCASVSNAPIEILRPHLDSILAQDLPKRVTLALAYISDGLGPETEKMLHEAGARVAAASPKPANALYGVSEETHSWNTPTFDWLGAEKERLLELAKEERFDAILYVDSDLVLGPETVASLVHASKDIVSANFWTSWSPGTPPLPQVWLRHPYELSGKGVTQEEFLRSLDHRQLVPVGGLGALTLIRERVFDKVSWAKVLGLPTDGMWQGEDRSFCINATRNHVELWADAWPDVFHVYRPSHLTLVEGWAARLPERPETPKLGDLVSFALEAIEERELHGRREHIRGRLGAIRVLPEIEDALGSMKRGESRVVKVAFPVWWKVESYRAASRNVLVRLLDVKRA